MQEQQKIKEKVKKYQKEVIEILYVIKKNSNILVQGGAGSLYEVVF